MTQAERKKQNLAMAVLCIIIPILSLAFQVLAKDLSTHLDPNNLSLSQSLMVLFQPKIIFLVLVEIATFVALMYVLSVIELSKAFPITGISYVLVILYSWFWLHEPFSPIQVLGGALILGGVFVLASADTPSKSGPVTSTDVDPSTTSPSSGS